MPAVMVDLDLIVWKNIGEYIAGTDICAIHREGIYPDVYPRQGLLQYGQFVQL